MHKGVFDWDNSILAEALQKGYLEHTDGFKLILPDFERFKQLDAQLNKASKAFGNYIGKVKLNTLNIKMSQLHISQILLLTCTTYMKDNGLVPILN